MINSIVEVAMVGCMRQSATVTLSGSLLDLCHLSLAQMSWSESGLGVVLAELGMH